MKPERYSSFLDLLKGQDPKATALSFFEDEKLVTWTYEALRSAVEALPLPEESCVGILAETNVSTIVALFALAGKRELVLLSPHEETSTLCAQIKATRVQRLLGSHEELETLSSYLHPMEKRGNDVLFFTSGTTSKAKAVRLTMESLLSATYNGGALLPLSSEDRLLSLLPLSHVYGFVCALCWPLSFGANVCLGRGMRHYMDDFDTYRPTASVLVPQMARFFLGYKLFNPELKLLLIGAGPCDEATLSGIQAKGIRVSYGYGLTECSSGIALSLGEDPRAMSVCPDYSIVIAEDGEILVRSETTLMKGYFEDEPSTALALQDGYLHTGDLGRLEGGKLYLRGRKKETLVFDDGSKIYLPEYEESLQKRLPERCDFAIIQDEAGRLALVYHGDVDLSSIVKEHNSHYPRSQQIVTIHPSKTPLPRTSSGKIARYRLSLKQGE